MNDDPQYAIGYGPFTINDPELLAWARVHDFGYLKDSQSQATLTRHEFDWISMRPFIGKLSRGARFRLLYVYRPIVLALGWCFWEKWGTPKKEYDNFRE